MKKIYYNSTVLFFMLVFVTGAYAQSDDIMKNPFLPRLPKREEPKPPVITQPVTPEQRPEPAIPEQVKIEEKIVPPPFVISGIVWNTDRPQAIVNAQVVDVGDKVEDAQIVAIEKTGITIQFKGKSFNITP